MPRKGKYLLLFIIIFSTILISGCSTIMFGPSGSIEVTTNPSGAKIFLDGKDTGKISPDTLKNVSVGSHIIEVTLSDIKCTKIAKVETYQTTNISIEFYPQVTLSKINVLPSTTNITLSLGNTVTISLLTAYYSDYSSANIPLANCTYSSNDACATVNSSGTITGISAGAAIITVSYTEGGITKTDTVLVYIRNNPTDTPLIPPVEDDIVYRALLVGVGDYINSPPAPDGDLDSPPYDVDKMRQTLEQCRFGSSDSVFSIINELKDHNATRTAILDEIASTFSGADDNDVSYFYFNGHGSSDNDFSTSYICPTDNDGTFSSFISVDELEIALSAIPGVKVVFLDSCRSGGFIGKSKETNKFISAGIEAFNNNVINIFSMSQSKDLLTTNQYKVLTSCHYNQSCYGIYEEEGIEPFSFFSFYLYHGCGYDGTYYADTDSNTRVSLNEAYAFVDEGIDILNEYIISIGLEPILQDVQIYPSGSNFTIVEY